VLQRNTSGIAIILPTLDPPVTVLPGEEIDHDEPLAGFQPADDDRGEQPRDTTSTNTKPDGSTSGNAGEQGRSKGDNR
jgi:hypothetical protein